MSSHELLQTTSFDSSTPGFHQRIGIVGAGKVGLSIALRLQQLSVPLWMVVRNEQRRTQLAQALPDISLVADVDEVPFIPDILLLCVPDTAIEAVSTSVAHTFGPALLDSLVLHCSGAMGTEVLASCEQAGARVAAAHPFQTFTHAHERLLVGIRWGIECEADDEERIAYFVRSLGGSAEVLSDYTRAHKALYHISAVFASNYVEAVIAGARQAAESAHIAPTTFLPPIIQSAVEASTMALAHQGRAPLSGPIARGDVRTVRRHLHALRSTPTLFRQYCYLSLATNEFALQQGYIDSFQYEELRDELERALLPGVG